MMYLRQAGSISKYQSCVFSFFFNGAAPIVTRVLVAIEIIIPLKRANSIDERGLFSSHPNECHQV